MYLTSDYGPVTSNSHRGVSTSSIHVASGQRGAGSRPTPTDTVQSFTNSITQDDTSHTLGSDLREFAVTTEVQYQTDPEIRDLIDDHVNYTIQYNSAADEFLLERAIEEHEARQFTENIRFLERLEHINHIDALHKADEIRERLVAEHNIPMSVIDILLSNISDLVAPVEDIPF